MERIVRKWFIRSQKTTFSQTCNMASLHEKLPHTIAIALCQNFGTTAQPLNLNIIFLFWQVDNEIIGQKLHDLNITEKLAEWMHNI